MFLFPENLRIITPIKDQVAREGQEIVFNCEVNTEGARPKWLKNEETIFDSPKYVMIHKELVFTLRIRDSQMEDQGTFTVALTNNRGEHAQCSASLQVHGK